MLCPVADTIEGPEVELDFFDRPPPPRPPLPRQFLLPPRLGLPRPPCRPPREGLGTSGFGFIRPNPISRSTAFSLPSHHRQPQRLRISAISGNSRFIADVLNVTVTSHAFSGKHVVHFLSVISTLFTTRGNCISLPQSSPLHLTRNLLPASSLDNRTDPWH